MERLVTWWRVRVCEYFFFLLGAMHGEMERLVMACARGRRAFFFC